MLRLHLGISGVDVTGHRCKGGAGCWIVCVLSISIQMLEVFCPVMTMTALGCCVCIWATAEWMMSQATAASAEGGTYTPIMLADVNSRGK